MEIALRIFQGSG